MKKLVLLCLLAMLVASIPVGIAYAESYQDDYLDLLASFGSSVDYLGNYNDSLNISTANNGSYDKGATITETQTGLEIITAVYFGSTNKSAETAANAMPSCNMSKWVYAQVTNNNGNVVRTDTDTAGGNSIEIAHAKATLSMFAYTGSTRHEVEIKYIEGSTSTTIADANYETY